MKDIHLSLLQEDGTYATQLINSEKIRKEVKYDDEIIEIKISSNDQDNIKIEEVSEEISNLIISIIKKKLLKEYISKQYSNIYFNEHEKIYLYSLGFFEEKESFIKDSIYTNVYNYILNNDYLNIEGFVKFRMKEFNRYISTIGDIAVEEYIMKKDQDEFINVLKYFVDIQDEKIDLVKVHIMKDNSFLLYDKNDKKLDSEIDKDIINMVIKEDLNYEDFLMSTLLTLCPEKIEILDLLQSNSSKEIIETIESIFGNRVTIVYSS